MILIRKYFKKLDIFQLTILLQGFASLFGLAVYAYLGIFLRLLADDYYHIYLLQGNKSLLTLSVEKYLFVSNRYATMSIFAFDQWFGIQWLAMLMIFLWLLGLSWLLLELREFVGAQLSSWVIISVSSFLIFLSLLQAPNLYQSIYWMSSSVTYFFPLVFFTFFFAGSISFLRHTQNKIAIVFVAILSLMITFFIGGLSETIGALNIGALFLAVLVVLIWGKEYNRGAALLLFGMALLGAFISLGLMAFSPANAIRSSAAPIAIPIFIQRVATFPFSFILDTLKTLPLPSFITILSAFLIFGSVIQYLPKHFKKKKNIYWGLALTPLIMYALIALSFAPSAYALSYPDARVRFPARVIMTFALFFEGGLLGTLFMSIRPPKQASKRHLFISLILMGIALYPLRGAWQAYQSIPSYQAYANAWDTRDAYIRTKKENGIMNIAVPPIDGMAGIKEFDIDPKHWVNQAAALYYGVDTISVHSSDLSYDE